jgi:PAS domain S-box-containing protein
MFGLGRESLYKKDIRELTLDKEMINKSDMELLLSSQRESLRIEKLMIKLDGFFWGSCGVSAIFDSDRHPVYMLYLIQNITKQKALQEELITSREQLQNILDFVNSMIVVTNGSEMKNCNRNLLDFFGFSTLEEFMLEHKCICDFFITKEGYLPETRRGYWLKEVLKQKENGMSTKVAIYDRKTDSDRIYLVDTHPFPGEKYFYIVSFTDITDMESHKKLLESTNTNLEEQVQRRTKELMDSYNRLSANEEFLSTIFNMASIGISIVDSRGSYIRVNSKFCEMYKICENELIGSNFTDILQESIRPDFMRLFEKYRDGKIKRMMPEWTLKLADGTVMDVFLTARWVTMYDGHRYLISTHLDITDKNRLQLKQREQERMLVQQSKMAAMGEMIGAIAHQWKQPLNAIALIAQCFKDDYEYNELNADVIDEHVSEIMKQVDFMNNTIDDFRNFFKPSKRMKKFNLCSAVMDVLSLITPQLKSSYIEVITDESCIIKKDTLVKGYPNEFKQVVLNILANSKDAILEQRHKKKLKGTEAGKIFISLKSENSTLCALFRDNGGGIPHDVMVHLFEPYFTTKGGGTGIGLYMSKTIIEDKMKGRIEASNTEDGAEFRIYLSKCGEGEEE